MYDCISWINRNYKKSGCSTLKKYLDFVCACRKGQPLNKEYDIIIGNVADDDVFKTVDMYFSQKEYEYFDYYLNKTTFNNGTDLRNMYLHGSQPNGPEDEKIHMSNYWIILKLFTLCILKICDDIETSAYINEHNLNVD